MITILSCFLSGIICFLISCISLIITIGLLGHRMICCVISTPLLIIGTGLLTTVLVFICMYLTMITIFAMFIPIGPIIELILLPLICSILCVMLCLGTIISIIFTIITILDLSDITITYCLVLLMWFIFYPLFATLVLLFTSSTFITEVDFIFPFLSALERVLKPLGSVPKDILNILDFKFIRNSPQLIKKLLNRLPSIGIPSVQGLCESKIFNKGTSKNNNGSIFSKCLNIRDLI